MDLKSGYPFWAVKNGLMGAFPPLAVDLDCDVVIVGGGISGALIARELALHGHEVAVFERRDIGWGSTAASTALLQYEIDTPLIDLAKRYGETEAVRAYRACADAIPALGAVAHEVRDVDFANNDSLYYASRTGHVASMREEFELRERHGFPVSWLTRGAVSGRYGIAAPAAILSRLGARIDPYRLTWRLFKQMQRSGVRIFDRTTIATIDASRRRVTLTTESGLTVRAGHVVLASGYESQRWLPKRVAKNRSSYAYISDPIESDALGALADTLVWESARPYLYLRTTGDGRLLVGGEDDAIDIPARRDASVSKKAARLQRRVASLLPHLAADPAFAWGGTFAETADGLPFFGAHPATGPRLLFAMAYGGNGITYSMAGAPLLRAVIERRRHPLRSIFGFGRMERH